MTLASRISGRVGAWAVPCAALGSPGLIGCGFSTPFLRGYKEMRRCSQLVTCIIRGRPGGLAEGVGFGVSTCVSAAPPPLPHPARPCCPASILYRPCPTLRLALRLPLTEISHNHASSIVASMVASSRRPQDQVVIATWLESIACAWLLARGQPAVYRYKNMKTTPSFECLEAFDSKKGEDSDRSFGIWRACREREQAGREPKKEEP